MVISGVYVVRSGCGMGQSLIGVGTTGYMGNVQYYCGNHEPEFRLSKAGLAFGAVFPGEYDFN